MNLMLFAPRLWLLVKSFHGEWTWCTYANTTEIQVRVLPCGHGVSEQWSGCVHAECWVWKQHTGPGMNQISVSANDSWHADSISNTEHTAALVSYTLTLTHSLCCWIHTFPLNELHFGLFIAHSCCVIKCSADIWSLALVHYYTCHL